MLQSHNINCREKLFSSKSNRSFDFNLCIVHYLVHYIDQVLTCSTATIVLIGKKWQCVFQPFRALSTHFRAYLSEYIGMVDKNMIISLCSNKSKIRVTDLTRLSQLCVPQQARSQPCRLCRRLEKRGKQSLFLLLRRTHRSSRQVTRLLYRVFLRHIHELQSYVPYSMTRE